MEVSDDHRRISFLDTEGKPVEVLYSDRMIRVSCFNVKNGVPPPGTWCVFRNVRMTVSTNAHGVKFYNYTTDTAPEAWDDKPGHDQMYSVLNQLYGPEQCPLVPIPLSLYPPLDKGVARSSDDTKKEEGDGASSSNAPVLSEKEKKAEDEAKKKERKEMMRKQKTEWNSQFYRNLSAYREVDPEEGTKLVSLYSAFSSRHIFLSSDPAIAAAGLNAIEQRLCETVVITKIAEWDRNIFIFKDDGTPAINSNASPDNPFNQIIIFKGCAECICSRIDMNQPDGSNDSALTVMSAHFTIFSSMMGEATGIMHPKYQQALLVPVLDKLNLYIDATVDAYGSFRLTHNPESTNSITTDDGSRQDVNCVNLNVHNVILDRKHFLTQICRQITPEFAAIMFRHYILASGGKVPSKKIWSISSITTNADPHTTKEYKWVYSNNSLRVKTDQNVCNLMEFDTQWDHELFDQHDFYVFSNAVFNEEYLVDPEDLITMQSDAFSAWINEREHAYVEVMPKGERCFIIFAVKKGYFERQGPYDVSAFTTPSKVLEPAVLSPSCSSLSQPEIQTPEITSFNLTESASSSLGDDVQDEPVHTVKSAKRTAPSPFLTKKTSKLSKS
jgi:hypothetical protein